MGNLVPSSRWDDVPYFEANAVLTGGPDCPDNLPIQALLNRTEHLKGMVENMSLGFDAVPETNKGLCIVVKQPHLRVMVWNGSQYVRAPWHQPCELFFSYDNQSSIPGALPVRADVSYQQVNYPDVVQRLGLSGSGTFSLVESRGEFLRVLDNGRGIDSGRVARSAQGDALQNMTGTLVARPSLPGVAGALTSGSGVFSYVIGGGGPGATQVQQAASQGNADIFTFDASAVARTANETRPRNVAFPLWMTI